jgi:hypothetical protein
MTTTIQTCSENFKHQIQDVLDVPLPGSADLFTALDQCAAFVCVMVECQDEYYRLALCGRLAHALIVLRQRCAEDLPENLVCQLTTETVPVTDVPDFWHDTEMLLDYADALTLALSGKTLLDRNSQDLVGLLHDLIYLLVDQLKTPFITHA